MDPGNGSKRARSESGNPSTSATTPAPSPPRDPFFEEQMNRFGLDAEFKASLRSMSPNSRAEVMNDIIRSQRAEQMQQMLISLGPVPPFPLGPMINAEVIMEENDEEESDADIHLAEQSDPTDEETPQRNANNTNNTNNANNTNNNNNNNNGHARITREALLRNVLFSLFPLSERIAVGGVEAHFINEISELIAQRSMGITQDIDDMSYEQLLELQERIGFVSKGITNEQMAQCTAEAARPKEGNCVVCQIEWGEGENAERCVELRTCKHVFHKNCIEGWLNANKTCPVCKQEVI